MATVNTPVPPRRRALSWGGDVGLIVAGTLFDIAALVNVPGAWEVAEAEGEISVTDFGTGLALLVVAAWITVRWRRTAPWVTVIAGALLAVVGISYVLLLIGAVSLARRRPDRLRPIALVTAGAVLLFAVREAVTDWGSALPWYFGRSLGAQYEPAWIVMSFVWALLALGVAAAVMAQSRVKARAAQSEIRADREHRRADAATEQVVRQAERERIARDMHDALAHRLSVVSLHAGALEAAAAAGQGDGGGTGDIARTVREQTHAALQDMRGLIGDLRRGDEAPPALPASMRAIGMLLADLRAGGAPVVPYVVLESPERAGALLDGAVFRIVQESLTNALKHAPGARIDVFVQVRPADGARIRIENPLVSGMNGATVPAYAAPAYPVPGGGNGTLGIRERAQALDGTAWIGAHEGLFIVDVTLPWHESV
ncbi:histidine kinase [Microbacterium esteraromaticum]|uniref:sensor histidine kinase n=1 Tax=Microbacterium esteraromaticum TaxID=57043 RepID=UPI002367C786|nr:histidine kinase [Microbacterium esteraromaticum]WDH79145.1 histidine kinase [Microbacterium esteraromaticum]